MKNLIVIMSHFTIFWRKVKKLIDTCDVKEDKISKEGLLVSVQNILRMTGASREICVSVEERSLFI